MVDESVYQNLDFKNSHQANRDNYGTENCIHNLTEVERVRTAKKEAKERVGSIIIEKQ